MKKCIRCENKINKENTLCDRCNELEKNQKGDKRIIVTIGIILLVLVIISLVFIAIIGVSDKKVENVYNECKNKCEPNDYSYNEDDNSCECIKEEEVVKNECSLLCDSDNFYINSDSDCVCDGGEKVFSNGRLVYSNSLDYEYEDNFYLWKEDIYSGKTIITVVANSSCMHCIRFQPVIHNLYNKYHFRLHLLHTDKLSRGEYDELFSYEYENYGGTPFTFIIRDGVVIDELSGFNTRENVEEFLRRNNVIK